MLKVKGSAWVENVIEKLDEDFIKTSNIKSHASIASCTYDSAKKLKFIKNGFAEQLQRVIRQEQTQKVLFKHRLKESNLESNEGIILGMKMKVISHHREGCLHVLECKVLAKGRKSKSEHKFYTVIMRHEEVVENDLDLLSIFTIFPPWKELHVEQHKFPVLICVYHVKVNSGGARSNSASQSETTTQDDTQDERNSTSSKVNEEWFQDCESLLEALEKQRSGRGICLAATIQRIFKTTRNSHQTWKFLCEDAFGVFFELSLDASTSLEATWVRLIKYGEGQRVYFQHLLLDTRIVRKKSPALFSVIDSVWDSGGVGLLQVQNSQSQDSKDACDTDTYLQPPSFCYKLTATRWQSRSYPFTEEEPSGGADHASSDLNRPKDGGSVVVDVLYQASKRKTISELLNSAKLLPKTSRFSLLVKVVHVYLSPDTIPPDNPSTIAPQYDTQDCDRILVIDETSLHSSQILSILISSSSNDVAFSPGNVVLMKDVRLLSDGNLIVDMYTQVSVLGKPPESRKDLNDNFTNTSVTPFMLYPDIDLSLLSECRGTRLPDLPTLAIDHKPGIFALIEGVVCNLSFSAPLNEPQCQLPTSSIDEATSRKIKSFESSEWIERNYSDKLDLVVDVKLAFKVNLKVLQKTVWNLVSEIETLANINSSSLNGKMIGPLPCFVYAKSQTSLQTMFCAEEIYTEC